MKYLSYFTHNKVIIDEVKKEIGIFLNKCLLKIHVFPFVENCFNVIFLNCFIACQIM